MVKEIYVWIAFFLVVIVAASYFRFFYQPSLSLSVNMPAEIAAIYPYQQVHIPISIVNTGSALISNMTLGLYVNRNVSTVYKVTVPSGKQANVYFNYTPKYEGTFNITIVADPSDLYNIANRQSSRNTTYVSVLNSAKAAPQAYFSGNGLMGLDSFNMSVFGYWLSAGLYYNYSVGILSLTGNRQIDNFFYPAFSVYNQFITGISTAHAYYRNSSLSDVWIKGYLSPAAITEVAIGKKLNVTAYNSTVAVINFGNKTTLCTFYSGGWIQNLASINGESCTAFLKNNNSFTFNSMYGRLKTRNSSMLNYSGYQGNLQYSGDIATGLNGSFLFESLLRGGNYTNVCYGNILNISNKSYCSTNYLIGNNAVLSENERLVGNYSINVWSISTTKYLQQATGQAIGVAGSYNLTGKKINFISGYSRFNNTCMINESLRCSNVSIFDGNMSMALTNRFNTSITLNSVSCSASYTPAPNTTVGITLAPNETQKIRAVCYDNGKVITGIPIYIETYLNFYYTRSGHNGVFSGYAYLQG